MSYPDIKIGQIVRFDPFRDVETPGVRKDQVQEVTGKVFYVSRKHGWFGVT